MLHPALRKLVEPQRLIAAPALVFFGLALGMGVAGPAQEAGDDSVQEGEGRLNPLSAFRENERARLQKEIQGSWLMTTLESESRPFDDLDFAGFAMFDGGFLSLILHGDEQVPSFLSGYQTKLSVQAHVFRYRISDRASLQAAGMLGFSNLNEDDELRFDGATNVAEYDISLENDELRLRHPDGRHFRFRRLEGGEFPAHAQRALRESRGSLSFEDGWDDE